MKCGGQGLSTRPWYKRFPGDFIAGTLSLSLEEKGAYSICLDLIYDRGGAIPDDPHWLSRVCGCSVRKWKVIRQTLITHGKLFEKDGTLNNKRAVKQAENEAKEARIFSENGVKGSRKTNEKKAIEKEINGLAEKGPEKTERHTRSQILDNKKINKKDDPEFEEFWKLCPRPVGKGKAREKYWIARREVSRELLLEAIKLHAKAVSGTEEQYIPHPATWLNHERYHDQPRQSQTTISKQNWPDWKITLGLTFGDHVVNTWFSQASFKNGVISAPRIHADRIRERYWIDLQKLGVKEVVNA